MSLLSDGQKLQTATSRASCKVGQLLGGGGQGEVYRASLSGHPVALKWYFPHMATAEQRINLEDLIRQGPPDARFLWPQEMVTDANVPGYGYIMELRDKRFCGIHNLMKAEVAPPYRVLCTAAYQLVDGYFQLHTRGYCYRDINFGNVFFDPKTGDVLICDNDNVVVNKSGPCSVYGTPRFMAPEIVRGDAMPSSDTDLYSMAVLLFYIFIVHHPLEGQRETNIRCLDTRAMNKIYGTDPLFIFDPNDSGNSPNSDFHKNALTYWPVYPRFFQRLFVQSFTEGLRDPEHGRVRENQWRSAVVRLRDSVMHCSNCDADMFYDADVVKETAGKLNPCLDCGQEPELPFRMRIEGQKTVVIFDRDAKLYPHHIIPDREFDFSRVVAEVSRHPNDPNKVGIRNLSDEKWVVTTSDGEKKDAEPGRTVRMVEGTSINFGGITGEFKL